MIVAFQLFTMLTIGLGQIPFGNEIQYYDVMCLDKNNYYELVLENVTMEEVHAYSKMYPEKQCYAEEI